MQLLDAFRKSPIFRNVAIRVICECLHHIMVRASLLYSYRCLAIPLNDNGNPAPFFLYCLQKENMMPTPRRIFKRVIDTLTTDSFFKEESSNEYPEVYLPDFIEKIIKEHPLTWENISERI